MTEAIAMVVVWDIFVTVLAVVTPSLVKIFQTAQCILVMSTG
ncbi:MAG TPA: hypothetical protein VKA09_05625 [Nitrososphaeraceae archaeon]|nr:hypothetical protein [Nitrososphaeraceae archaeon]